MKFTVVHRGARDHYQVALAMAEAGMLGGLVTDLYWPGDRAWAARLKSWIPAGLAGMLRARTETALPSRLVRSCWLSGAASLGLSKLRRIPFAWQRNAIRWTDGTLGRYAGRFATNKGTALLSYSYYGHSSFSNFQGSGPRVLFQLHPHPEAVRNLLMAERARFPECAASLDKEWELSLPSEDFATLCEETQMADRWIAASTFTKQTLAGQGVDPRQVDVVPYGVDLEWFRPDERLRTSSGPLKLLFAGTVTQRKGIKYLLQAVQQFRPDQVQLTVCGRVVDDLALFQEAGNQVTVKPSVSNEALLEEYRQADLFVFPSVAEGFGHVLLEALACGLPVLSTTHTAAPDLLTEGEDGFVVEPGSVTALADRIAWCVAHREALHAMRPAARRKAEQFSWPAFRKKLVAAVARV